MVMQRSYLRLKAITLKKVVGHIRNGIHLFSVALIMLILGLLGCVGTGSDKDDEGTTMIAPQVKVGLPQAGPASLCSATVRYWFAGDEFEHDLYEHLDDWFVHYDQVSPIDFLDPTTGGVTWHCVYDSPLAHREPPDGLIGPQYEILPLVPDELVYDPATLVIYSGGCNDIGYQITEEVTNFVNFTTTEIGCVIDTDPLSGFP